MLCGHKQISAEAGMSNVSVHWEDFILYYTRYNILNPPDRSSPVLSPSCSFLGESEFWLPPAQHDRVQRPPAYSSCRPLLPVRSSLLPLPHPLHWQLPLWFSQPPGGAVCLQEDCLCSPYSAPEGCGHQMLVSRQRERPSLHLPGRPVWTSCGWWDLHLCVLSHSCVCRRLLQLLRGLPVWPLRDAVGACGLIPRERKLLLSEGPTWEPWREGSTDTPPSDGFKKSPLMTKLLFFRKPSCYCGLRWGGLFNLHWLNFIWTFRLQQLEWWPLDSHLNWKIMSKSVRALWRQTWHLMLGRPENDDNDRHYLTTIKKAEIIP